MRQHAEAIARTAKAMVDLCERWLNPPEWTERVPQGVPLRMDHSPYPDGIVARPGREKALASRTLTNLTNQRRAWQAHAHAALDPAEAAAHGRGEGAPDMADEEVCAGCLG